jgi:hypothetical protein
MKTVMPCNWREHLLFTTIATIFLLVANSSVVAQTNNFKPGDRVQCDWLQNGRFDEGTVVPFLNTDLDQRSGRWYRVKLDKDRIPNSTVECMANRLRPLTGETNSGNNDESKTNKSEENDTRVKSSAKNKPRSFQPGDRVECDKAQIGRWEKGTVMNYLPDDTDRGSYVRVRLDGYKLYAEGHQCMMNFVRPINGASLKSSGRYKVGDAIEAKNQNGSWLPAKIIAVDGAFYKVRFDNRDSRYDEKIDELRIRRLGTAENESTTKNPTSKIGSVPHSLPGTAWKIDFGRGTTGTTFLFCKSGSWEIVPERAGSIGAVGSSYRVSGNTLTTVNRDDGKVEKWRVSWEGDVLILNDGKVTLKLHYNGETQCR